ncbi:SidA/IucD/PvdA family monooxygenase, partial [[Kitasatospora] papulosa]|uniref:SidA/IucD/PvdA family monooxygenase n=1 Tax=[Kitasatospora] papulosa TaxID=1464011 RepID=UPI0036CFF94E
MTSQTIHPVLGVGFGPANLSLAGAREERDPPRTAHIIERSTHIHWHPHQLLSGAEIPNKT